MAITIKQKTTIRIYGYYPSTINTSIYNIIYCPPVSWVGMCWNFIHRDTMTRMSARAWEYTNTQIVPRNKKFQQYPSTGAMAVEFSMNKCAKTFVYGFGYANRKCQKYYMNCNRNTPYWLEDYHDFKQEWKWYCKLHEKNKIIFVDYYHVCIDYRPPLKKL